MTVEENLQMGATVCDPKYFEADLARAFSLFPILEKRRAISGVAHYPAVSNKCWQLPAP